MKDEGFNLGDFLKSWGIPIIGFVSIFSVARADVGNLKERVSRLEQIPEVVSSMRTDLQSMKEQQMEMRQDIKTLLQRGR